MTTPTLSDKLGDFFSVQLSPNVPVPIINGIPGQTVTLANQDLVNNVTISRKNSVSGGAVIPPLGSVTVDMSKTIWGTAPANTLPLLVFPGGGSWAPSPAQVAAQINALGLAKETTQAAQSTTIPNGIFNAGVPLANKSTILLNVVNQNINAGATFSAGPISLSQPTAEVLISTQNGAADASSFVTLTLQWSDSTSGIVLEPDTYQLGSATAANSAVPIHGILVAHGDTLTVSVKNQGSTACTLNLLILNNSKPTNVDTELWRYLASPTATFNGYDVFAASDIGSNYIANASVSVGTGTTGTLRTLPIYIGAPIQIIMHTGSGLNDLTAVIQICSPISGALGYGDRLVWQQQSNGSGDIFASVWLPRVQCLIRAINGNASSRTVNIDVVGTT